MATYSRKRKRRHLLPIAVLAGLAYLGGLLWFSQMIPTQRQDERARPTDAIVVLTGAGGRIAEGLDLLAQERGQKLFISGVYRGVEVQQLLQLAQRQPDEMLCCITLGYEAQDTAGNALETADWMAEQGYRSLTLVTSAHHMPRSLLEFRYSLPNVAVAPHPVLRTADENGVLLFWVRWAYSAFREYNKYLLTGARLLFTELQARLLESLPDAAAAKP